ncbi:MAG TPA: hypothetical protein VK177_10295 [Flavobacteriales bacterium]|nr:hypothetical protein [Flavobacteriales bacterium]
MSNVFNHRLGLTCKPKTKSKKYGNLTMSVNATWMQRLPLNTGSATISELTVFANIGYSF